ncbi:MAG TPA: XdhC family protein [Rhizobiaceae bacterium]|nr:XdhC family protein [Rhizobiaceae bacterium]
MKDRQGRWDMFDDYVVDFACDQAARSIRTAIVTLVEIEGSSPLRVGAQMAVAETGEWVGYLSGGCIERAIAAEACAAIWSGAPRRVRYGRGSPYMDIRLPCGGAIELVIDVGTSMPPSTAGCLARWKSLTRAGHWSRAAGRVRSAASACPDADWSWRA